MEKNAIFYLGGSPCAGKSTVAKILAERYGLRLLHLDDRLYEHIAAAVPQTQPALASIAAADCEQLWMIPPKLQARRTIHAFIEEFPFHLRDIAGLDGPLLLEGAALLPCLVAPQLVDRTHALYMVPTEPFQQMHYAQRPWIHEIVRPCSDPAVAFQNWMRRDAIFARWIRRDALEYGLKTVIVDGGMDIAAHAEIAANYFGLGA
ncbi:MAG: hypothetical protein K8L99_10785 [Anaerolineae bacterium]|nr:hypothetical protein [Anaerolineae bacterium]